MKKNIKEIISYLIIIVVVLLIRQYFYSPIRVNGKSMYPTLENKEIMILDKISLKKGINRFDIVVVKSEGNYIIKRVIGLPGETITYENNKLYINGKHIEDNYALSNMEDFELVKLGEDEFFVMGDNRENSKDSRMIGPVKKEQIQGKAKLVIFPFSKVGIKEWKII